MVETETVDELIILLHDYNVQNTECVNNKKMFKMYFNIIFIVIISLSCPQI